MTIQAFEKEIQRDIDPDLEIRRTQADICGVFHRGKFIGISTPAQFIFDKVHQEYRDWFGVIHRSKTLAKHLIAFKLKFILS
jgi:hypothetical protein